MHAYFNVIHETDFEFLQPVTYGDHVESLPLIYVYRLFRCPTFTGRTTVNSFSFGFSVYRATQKTEPTRHGSAFFQCGLGQLRLFARPTRCFGHQNYALSASLLFRLANALTRLGENVISNQQRHTVFDWADGFWRGALQQQTFGPPPPNTTLISQNRSTPHCSGSASILMEDRLCRFVSFINYHLSPLDLTVS